MKKNELKYFKMIRDFFEIFLPNQKGASKHTIKSYKICMNQFLDFAKASLGIKLRDCDFNHTTIELVESFLEYGENEYHWSAKTRNLKLAAIRSFYKYSANHDITLIDIYLKLNYMRGISDYDESVYGCVRLFASESAPQPNKLTCPRIFVTIFYVNEVCYERET